MVGDDNSLDQDAAEDVKDELKFELAILNGALKPGSKYEYGLYGYHPPIAC
jgi:hypothetical protein